MFKKLFALLMVLSVAVLFTGCSNSNSYDKVPRPEVVIERPDGDFSGRKAYIAFEDKNHNPMDVVVDIKKGWEIAVSLNGKTKVITAEENQTEKYLDITLKTDGVYEVSAVSSKAGSHSLNDVEIEIRKFVYVYNDMTYTYTK